MSRVTRSLHGELSAALSGAPAADDVRPVLEQVAADHDPSAAVLVPRLAFRSTVDTSSS
jgi:hypothetical protein